MLSKEKMKDNKRRSRVSQSEILLVGVSQRIRPVASALSTLSVPVVKTKWHERIVDEIGDKATAVILVAPLVTVDMSRAVKRIHDRHRVPLFAVIKKELPDSQIRKIYESGANAVLEWPREARIFPGLIAEMIALEQVRGKTGAPDEALSRSIEARLKLGLRRGLKIHTHEGVAFLSGMVDALWKKGKVEDIIARVPGVKGVVAHHLHVSSSGLADRVVSNKVRSVLRSTSDIDTTTISMSVRNGHVSLAGSAADRLELERMNEIISHVKGVRGIDNLATVSRLQKEKDHVIARRIRKVLALLFPREKVSVSVFGGVAVLSGRVRILTIKREVEKLAREDNAVHRVINKIEVI
jgi:osmotically-inducible protein OsmY